MTSLLENAHVPSALSLRLNETFTLAHHFHELTHLKEINASHDTFTMAESQEPKVKLYW